MSPRLAFALEAAVRGGRSTLAHFQTSVRVELKADATPVTIADREAERIIRSEIERAYPGEAVLGEEEGLGASPPQPLPATQGIRGEGLGKVSASDRWVVDPIDGTKSFVCGVPLFATLISFERDGEPEVAACYMPALDEIVYAEKGGGAFWNGRPCRVSERKSLDGAVLSCGGHASMVSHGCLPGFLKLANRAMATRTWSDAYGHALVATGRVDAMIDPVVNRWDISAVSLIVREAGGMYTDLNGCEALGTSALSTNGALHEEILRTLRK